MAQPGTFKLPSLQIKRETVDQTFGKGKLALIRVTVRDLQAGRIWEHRFPIDHKEISLRANQDYYVIHIRAAVSDCPLIHYPVAMVMAATQGTLNQDRAKKAIMRVVEHHVRELVRRIAEEASHAV